MRLLRSHGAEPKYFVQFYVFTGVTGTGDVRIFEADGNVEDVITVAYNQSTSQFKFAANPGGTTTADGIVANRWYMIRFAWDNQTNDNMTIVVKGNGSDTLINKTINGVNANQLSARDFVTRAKPKTDAIIADVKRQAEAKFGKS